MCFKLRAGVLYTYMYTIGIYTGMYTGIHLYFNLKQTLIKVHLLLNPKLYFVIEIA